MKSWPFFLVMALLPGHAAAQDASAPAAGPAAAAPALVANPESCCRLAAGTLVDVEILDPLRSDKQQRGDKFALRVTVPVLLDGKVLIPAGTLGEGQIVHASPSHGGGQPGELLLAARFLDLGGQTIPLRGLKLGQSTTGRDNSALSAGMAPALGLFTLFIHGTEIEIPPHTEGVAKLAQDTVFAGPANPAAPAEASGAPAPVGSEPRAAAANPESPGTPQPSTKE